MLTSAQRSELRRGGLDIDSQEQALSAVAGTPVTVTGTRCAFLGTDLVIEARGKSYLLLDGDPDFAHQRRRFRSDKRIPITAL